MIYTLHSYITCLLILYNYDYYRTVVMLFQLEYGNLEGYYGNIFSSHLSIF